MHYCITSTCRRLTFSSLLLLILPPSSASSTLLTQALSPQQGLQRHHQPPVLQGRHPLWQRCYLQLLDWIVHVQGALHTIHGYIQYWCHINAKSTDCTVRMPSLTYMWGHVGKVTNDWTLMGRLYIARSLFPLTSLFCTDLVSDMQH